MTTLSQDQGGILGAKRATWRDTNPRELLRRIVAENPKADETVWRKKFWEEIKDDEDYQRAIADYFLDNAIRALGERRASTRPAPAQRQMTKQQTKSIVTERVTRRVTEKVEVALLELMIPNGKLLGDCTGAECKQIGKRFGDCVDKVGDIVPANVKVRDHLTEAQAWKLWRKTV